MEPHGYGMASLTPVTPHWAVVHGPPSAVPHTLLLPAVPHRYSPTL